MRLLLLVPCYFHVFFIPTPRALYHYVLCCWIILWCLGLSSCDSCCIATFSVGSSCPCVAFYSPQLLFCNLWRQKREQPAQVKPRYLFDAFCLTSVTFILFCCMMESSESNDSWRQVEFTITKAFWGNENGYLEMRLVSICCFRWNTLVSVFRKQVNAWMLLYLRNLVYFCGNFLLLAEKLPEQHWSGIDTVVVLS